jgi:protein-L-isoaspartate(D-aspartate) O-methyltransferase
MDFERARFNMVEQQIRTWDVLDPAVLDLLFAVKREDFVPNDYRNLAFVDMEVPIGHGQTMMTPKLEARFIQELAIKSHERVLEIGTGSGYLTALLAKRGCHVTSIEINAELSRTAAAKLAAASIANVDLLVGDAAQSPTAFVLANQTFEVIVLTGSVPILPAAYLDYLPAGGRMLAVVGDAPAMRATLVSKSAGGGVTSAELFETVLPPLINCQQPSRFVF